LSKESVIMKESFTREQGQGLVEYALILVLVAVVVIAILLVLGPVVGNVFSTVVAVLDAVGVGGGGGLDIAFVGSPLITSFPTWGGCTYTATWVQVNVTQGGDPVSGASVGGTVTIRDSDENQLAQFSVSGTSGSSGYATLFGNSPSSGCGGHKATVSISGGPSQTVSIP
jgi:pilus assembly protein Flp/PilA